MMLKKFIEISWELFNLNNYWTMMAVMAGLKTKFVWELDVWDNIDDFFKSKFTKLDQICSSQ